MSQLFPFRAIRPAPPVAPEVASVPYDVVNTEEARALASGHPLSFLRVTRSEIDLTPDADPYSPAVYDRAIRNFDDLRRSGPFVMDEAASLYVYRLRMGDHVQTGLAGCFSVEEYERGLVKKHEKTRQDKEDDRTRHIDRLGAQTGLVFLTYRAQSTIDGIIQAVCESSPLYDFVAPDGVEHVVWRVIDEHCSALVSAFGDLDAVYIADGHHRAASAARVKQLRGAASKEAARFVAVAFPDNQVRILPYNRVVKDLAGQSPEAFLEALRRVVGVADGGPVPSRKGEVSMFVGGRWYTLELPPPSTASRADALDVEVLQKQVLEPLLKVGDPRTDKRIDFVGGIRGPAELERLVSSGRAAIAFSMHPVSVEDLMAIADAGGIMPPKSTWFEPKLRDGLLVHAI